MRSGVACRHVSGLSVWSHMTAGFDGFRGSRPYQLVGIRIPLRRRPPAQALTQNPAPGDLWSGSIRQGTEGMIEPPSRRRRGTFVQPAASQQVIKIDLTTP